MDNEKEIKKAHKKFKKELLNKKAEWKSIRIDKELETIRAMHDLMSAGLNRIDAREIIEREAREDNDAFRFVARNHIEDKKKRILKQFNLTK